MGRPDIQAASHVPVRFPADHRPILTVIVDTEEEFDWGKPHSRSATAVSATQDLYQLQEIFDEANITPCYVVDYPIVSSDAAVVIFRSLLESNRCTIGAHVHPWVNPPFHEEVCARNSYPGNLPRDLEKSKLQTLLQRIESNLGIRATVYRAGRSGIGVNSYSILVELGFEADVSAVPAFDFSSDGGPDFTHHPLIPFWFGENRQLISLPISSALVGILPVAAPAVYRIATTPIGESLHLPGILARLRLVDRLQLTPEGYSLEDMIRLTTFLYAKGIRVFSLSLHSPSVRPGCTPYVQSRKDLVGYFGRLKSFFEFFFVKMGGIAMTPLEVRKLLRMKSSDS